MDAQAGPAQRQAMLPLAWPLAVASTAALLLASAIYNRFPLLFPDTSTYLRVAYEHVWTLDRSGFYGLAFKPFVLALPGASALWAGLTVQLVAIAAVLVGAVHRICPDIGPLKTTAAILLIAIVTSLPWHSAQLMPDAFAGPLVLVTWMAASRNVGQSGTALLWLAAAGMTLLHYTYLGIVPPVALLIFAVAWWSGVQPREIAKRCAALVICIAAVAASHVVVNGAKFDRWSVSPMGSLFLFARLNEDGLVDPWFDRHCGRDASERLCAIRGSIPTDSQIILWGRSASPFDSHINAKPGNRESWSWIDDLQQAAVGSIREQPVAFLRNSLGATARQFVHFQALDDECPARCKMPGLGHAHPALKPPIDNSRQVRGEMPTVGIRAITTPVATIGLLLLAPLIVIAWRIRDAVALSLLLSVVTALLANAAMAGALSDVHDRYQSRLVWLAPFAVLLAFVRWRSLRRRIDDPGPMAGQESRGCFPAT